MKSLSPLKYSYFLILTFCLFFYSAQSHAIDWPQEVDTSEGVLVVYQPQPETLTGNTLTARAAMSFNLEGKEPTFGVFWFTATIDTDRNEDSAAVRGISVTQVRWPDSNDSGEQRFTAAVNNALKTVKFDTSLSQLTASLESAESAEKSLADIKNDPPNILFEETLSVLLSFDGEPRFGKIENTTYERALNTVMTVVRDTQSKRIYLTDGANWYQSDEVKGPYEPTDAPPAELVNIVPKLEATEAGKAGMKIVVTTEPAELITTDGPADWKSLANGELMYVYNTETPWLRELSSNNMYVLLSGRWYRAKKQTGPWTFVRADELPKSFADIPPASDLGGLRVSVAGTEEANEAILDAKVPQTAAISRSSTTLTISYDGEPQFEKIDGTNVSYAINTDAQVILVDKLYYAVDNAVWFKADSAMGPWKVADKIPKDEIAKIPPSSPVYNITYVDIYESTPEIVYVGYYPGYMWSYPYYGVPVYGTGWYYPPYWHGGFYYPRPPTWGFHAGYHNGHGWSYGVSWGNGFFNVGMNWNGGYHGPHHPPHYRPPGRPVVINTGDINIGNRVNIGQHNNINTGEYVNNIYKRTDNLQRNASPEQVKQNIQSARASKDISNNVFADKEGNVVKHDGEKWQQRDSGEWKDLPSKSALKEKAGNVDQARLKEAASTIDRSEIKSNVSTMPSTRPVQSDRVQRLNNANHARQSGMQRQQMRQVHRSVPHRGH